ECQIEATKRSKTNEGRAFSRRGLAFGQASGTWRCRQRRTSEIVAAAFVSVGIVTSQPREARPGGHTRAIRAFRAIRGLCPCSSYSSLLRSKDPFPPSPPLP